MQAFSHWSPPGGTLGRILGDTRERVAALKERKVALESAIRSAPPGPSLAAALRGKDVAIIAEVKRRSPSRGAINPALDAAGQARAYRDGGARAISVLTEGPNFGGSVQDLQRVATAVELPVLKKDFHVDPVQVLEARALGASALLLIARAVTPQALRELAGLAADLGVEPLVEVRDERELDTALGTAAEVIGVNARDLETLRVDVAVCEHVVPRIPGDRIAVYESGVAARPDVENAALIGADAVLVGSALSGADAPAEAVRALCGVARRGRG